MGSEMCIRDSRETEPSFRDDFLVEQSIEHLLIDSIDSIAESLRGLN